MTIANIRKAGREDAAVALGIRREAIRHQCVSHYPRDDLEKWTAGQLSEEFSQAVADIFHVAIVDERIVGTGAIDLGTGKVDAIFVLPAFMGRGIGRAMMDYLEGLARGAGLRSLSLEATLNAAPFYRAQGFQGEGTSIYHSPAGISLACVPMLKVLQEQQARN